MVIIGRNPDDPSSIATMWVIPGEPLTAIAKNTAEELAEFQDRTAGRALGVLNTVR